MKSSSRFFPVRLMEAESDQGIAEDVYLLKPNNSPDKSVELAVTHLSRVNRGERDAAPGLLLLHGQYQNRGVFWRRGDPCLARHLVEQGLDVWLVELRGHGLSPVNDTYDSSRLSDYARYDLPAVAMFVAEQLQGRPLHWFASGLGAGALLTSIGLGLLDSAPAVSLLCAGAPFNQTGWAKLPGTAKMMAVTHRRNLDIGPESEPSALMEEVFEESQWFKTRGERLGLNLWQSLAAETVRLGWLGTESELARCDQALLQLHRDQHLHAVAMSESLIKKLVMGELSTGEELASVGEALVSWIGLEECCDGVSGAGEVASTV